MRVPFTAVLPALRSSNFLVSGNMVDQGLANTFSKEPDSQYFQLCGVIIKDSVAQLQNSAIVMQNKLYIVTQLCLTLCNPMDCSLPGPSVRGVIQARKEAIEDTEMAVTVPRKTLLIKSGDVLGLALSHSLLPLVVGKKCNLVLIYIFLARLVKVNIFRPPRPALCKLG